MQTFQQILMTQGGEPNATFRLTEDWTQGRTIHGGVIAGLAHQAMKQRISVERVLRAMHITFASPSFPGVLLFDMEVIREGKSVSTVLTRALSGGATNALITGIYGASRPSVLSTDSEVSVPQFGPEKFTTLEFPVELIPNHLKHFEIRFVTGNLPYSGGTDRSHSAYVRFTPGEATSIEISHLLALTDVLPTPALSMLNGYSPASTLSWTIELIDQSTNFSPEQWWYLDATVDASLDGYSVYTLHLLNPNNRVAAISRQVVAIFG